MRDDVRKRLVEVARYRGLIQYEDLMTEFGLARGTQIANVLTEICEYERNNGRPFLSAVVVSKAKLEPSTGFWSVPGVSRNIPWENYRNEVHNFWWRLPLEEYKKLL